MSLLALVHVAAALVTPLLPGNAITFPDAQHGWAAGSGGIVATRDGVTWSVQSHTPVGALAAVDATHAWALGGEGFVLRTTNGRTWQILGAPHLVRVQFVDRVHGFGLYRDGVVVRSADAGRSWPQVRTPGTMQTECFAGLHTGWVARGGSVWTTRDGGTTWARRRLLKDRQGYPLPDLGCRGGDVWVLFHGGVAAGSEGYVVFRSHDAGRTWRAVLANLDPNFATRVPRIGPGYSGPFSALGDGRAIFVGICGPCGRQPTDTFARTVDGGRMWTRATPFNGVWVDAISFIDSRVGFALTTSPRGRPRTGLIWETRDGGRRWRRLHASRLVVSG
ncbi:MAG: hypothetical protein E6G32_01330 [Actinobacteria bacterium]|nr:MAG: hypothetical protein E6G32_01330 [Actinomycetota bacterium]